MLKSTLDSSILLHQILLYHIHHPPTYPQIWSPNKYSSHILEISPKFSHKKETWSYRKKMEKKTKGKNEKKKERKEKDSSMYSKASKFQGGFVK